MSDTDGGRVAGRVRSVLVTTGNEKVVGVFLDDNREPLPLYLASCDIHCDGRDVDAAGLLEWLTEPGRLARVVMMPDPRASGSAAMMADFSSEG